MNKQIASIVPLIGMAAAAAASVTFTYNDLGGYNGSDEVLVASGDLTSNSFIRGTTADDRVALQTFQVGSNMAINGVNIVVSRLFDDARSVFALYDLGTSLPAEVASTDFFRTSYENLTPLAEETVTISGADAAGFGNATDGWNDADSTLSWTFSSVSLDSTHYYAFVMDGDTVNDDNASIVWRRADSATTDPYAGGIGFYDAEGNKLESDVFGSNVDADWSLALVAVPEPSTTALLLGCLALGGVLIRRRIRE